MKNRVTATLVILALLSTSPSASRAEEIDRSKRISADSFSNVGEDNDQSSLMKMSSMSPSQVSADQSILGGGSAISPQSAGAHMGFQSLAQGQVSADIMATSGTLKMIQDHQNKMDQILESADTEMNLGRQELENID